MTLAARPDGSFVALLPDANAIIRGDASGQQSMIRFDPGAAFAPDGVDYVAGDDSEPPAQSAQRPAEFPGQPQRPG